MTIFNRKWQAVWFQKYVPDTRKDQENKKLECV